MTDIRHTMEVSGTAAKDLEEISAAAASVDDELTDISKTAPAMGKAMKAGLGVGLGAVTLLAAGIFKASKDTLKLAGDLNTLAKRGRGVRALASEIDTLDKAFGLLTKDGVDSARVLEDVNQNLGEVARGSAEATAAFAELGLEADDLIDLNAVDRVRLLVDRLSSIEDPAKRADVASQTLGRSWRSMLAVFESGEGALDTAIDQVRQAGVVSDVAAAQSEALIDAVDLAKQTWSALTREALEPLIPVLTGVLLGLTNIAQTARDTGGLLEWIRLIGDISSGAILATAAMFGLNTEMGRPEGERLGKRIGELNTEIELLEEVVKAADGVTGELNDQWFKFAKAAADAGIPANVDRLAVAFDRLDAAEAELAKTEERSLERTREIIEARKDLAGVIVGGGGGGGAPPVGGGGGAPSGGGGAVETVDLASNGFSDLFDQASAVAGAVDLTSLSFTELGERIRDLSQPLEESQSSFDQFQQVWEDGLGSIVNAIGAIATTVFDELASAQRRLLAESVDEVRSTAREIEGIERQLTKSLTKEERRKLEARKGALEERSEAEKAAALEAFNTQKALAIVSVVISTALAVINSFATAPTIAAGAVFAVVSAAAGVASGITIGAQQPPSFARGGVLREGDIPMVGGQVSALMEPGEGVLTKQGLRGLGGARALEDMNAGRGGGGMPPIIVMKVGARTTEAIATEQLRDRGGRMSTALRTARPKVGRRVARR